LEAESAAAVFAYFSPLLRFFRKIEVYHAMPIEEVMRFASMMRE